MVRDVRIFVNTIDHAIRLMTDNGVPATAHREEKDGYIEYTVRASPPPPRRSKVFHVERGEGSSGFAATPRRMPLSQARSSYRHHQSHTPENSVRPLRGSVCMPKQC